MVAHASVYPKNAQNEIHNKKLPAHMAMVEVIKVIEEFVCLKLENPPKEEVQTLGLSKGYFLMWPKELIRLITQTPMQTAPSPATEVPPTGPSLDYHEHLSNTQNNINQNEP